MKGRGLSDVRVGTGGFGPLAGSRFLGEKQARKRAEGLQRTFRLQMIASIEVLPPLLQEVLFVIRQPC